MCALRSGSPTMTTRATTNHSQENQQGRGCPGGACDSHQPSYPPKMDLQEYCTRIATEVHMIPAMLGGYAMGSQGNFNRNDGHYCYNQETNRQLQQANDQLARQDASIRHLEQELKLCKREVQTLRAKEQSLRDSVFDNESYQEISEEELTSAYGSLAQGIQQIAGSKLLQVEGRNLDFEGNPFAIWEEFSELWGMTERKGRSLILRALLSQILSEDILQTEFFAISESKVDENGKPEANSALNARLGKIERLLSERRVPHDILTNWRLSTLRSVEAAGLTGKVFGAALAEEMYHFFSPLVIEASAPEKLENLQAQFRELCNKAYTLRLLMRKSRHEYHYDDISPQASADEIKRFADIIQELDIGLNSTRYIALSLCGALVISPWSPNGNLRILEKGQVAIFRY